MREIITNIADIRLKRNCIIHDFASLEAMVVRSKIDTKLAFDAFQIFNGNIKPQEFISELTRYYKLLIEAGNLVFLLEKEIADNIQPS